MKLFNLLKNKAGKLVMGAPQLVTIAGVGLMATYGAFKTDQVLDQEASVRALSSVSSSYAYEGLNRKSDGMLSSMNIQNRGVAVGEDRERLEGNRSKSDFGLSAADNLGRRVSVPGTGSAAATSATDGLGSGGVDMVEINYGASSSRASVPINPGVVSQGAYGGVQQSGGGVVGEGSGGKLASASMARASGNAFNAASGSVGGSSSSVASGRGGVSSRASGSDGYNFSGSMPSGSNVVSAYNGLNGSRMSGSSFMAGGRNATVGRRGGSANGKDDLKKISKMSADVAKDRNRGAASGARPFLANSATSAGMSIDAEAAAGASAGSADFETPESRNLKAIGDWGQQQEKKVDDRKNARNRLFWMALAMIAATIAAIPLGSNVISAGRKMVYMGQLLAATPMGKTAGAAMIAKGRMKMALGWVILGAAMAYAATVLGFAIGYISKYGGGILGSVVSLLAITSGIVLFKVGKNAMTITGDFQKDLANADYMAVVKGTFTGLGAKAGPVLVQQAAQTLITPKK